ncbi:hypothetical protein DIDNDMLP_00227 [Klebsiella phage KP13-7]|nr:hypothetical protein DIDNDMLP_00227 [Klebsiella phage KP13-7]
MTILFSTEDPFGNNSSVLKNLNNHLNRKTNGSWGSDKHSRKLFPRGKTYDRLFDIHLDTYMEKNFI